jgi:hypothetical protein
VSLRYCHSGTGRLGPCSVNGDSASQRSHGIEVELEVAATVSVISTPSRKIPSNYYYNNHHHDDHWHHDHGPQFEYTLRSVSLKPH